MFDRIAIVGFGLIGGSVALALRERWPQCRIIAIDRQAVVDTARRLQAADAGGDDLALAEGADLILLAAPVRQNISVLRDLVTRVRGHALVTDVGSTKRAMVEAARHLPQRLRFVGGHPLAGAATGGIEAARPDLFRGRPWILTPSGGDRDADDVERLSGLASAVGALPRTMDPIAHDRLMAYLSHLPQLTVSALMQVVGERAGREGLSLAGTGLRDTTRLASSPAGTWRDVTATNVDALGAAIDDLTAALQRLKKDLTVGQELQQVFDAAAAWKRTLDESEATRMYLEMTDPRALRPGEVPDGDVRVTRRDPCEPEFWRHLYSTVGAAYHWVDRLPWTEHEIRTYLTDPAVSLWVMTVGGTVAGYFELRREEDASVEIVYFGLLPEFTGRGLGGYLLTAAVERAWASGARRVWLHTCSLDHPFALQNYLDRGFTVFKTEQYVVEPVR